jgi:hypothetical protein
VAWIEDKKTRVALKWALYLGLLGVILLISFVLDRDRTHALHLTFKDRLAAAIGAAITLGLYSFLFGENEIYRFLEHLIIGIVLAQGLIITYSESVKPMWLKPIGEGLTMLASGGAGIDVHVWWGVGIALVGFASVFVFFWLRLPLVGLIVSTALFVAGAALFEVARRSVGGHWNPKLLWLLAPIPGSLWYMMYSKRYLWLSRLIVVFMIGAFLGQAFKQNFSNLLSQIQGTFKPMWVPSHGGSTFWWLMDWWGNLIFVIIAFVVLFYFIFTLRMGEHPLSRRTHLVSRFFMMIAFGIVFGTVVGTRMGLVTDRIYFLVEEWAKPIVNSWF